MATLRKIYVCFWPIASLPNIYVELVALAVAPRLHRRIWKFLRLIRAWNVDHDEDENGNVDLWFLWNDKTSYHVLIYPSMERSPVRAARDLVGRQAARHITMRFAPPRASRAPEYTALMARGHVNDVDEVWRGMADGRSCWRRVANL